MNRRAAAVGLAAALAIGTLGAPAGAQDGPATGDLRTGDVDVGEYPQLEVVVSLPSGAGTEDPEFAVEDDGNRIVPEVVPLAATPLDVVLAIDTSGSMSGGALDAARAAALAFSLELPATARIGLIGFGPDPVVASPLTRDRQEIAAALIGLRAAGETALYDAVTAAADLVDPAEDARTALIVLSDGGDTVSEASLAAAADASATRFDVVHAVALATSEQDASALGELVSGGGVVAQAEDPVGLAGVYADVGDRVINQYALRWETTRTTDGEVTISFDDGSGPVTVIAGVDVDDALVAEFEAPAAPDQPATPTTEPRPEVTVPPVTEPQPAASPSTLGPWVLWIGVGLTATALFLAGLVATMPAERRRYLAAELRQHLPTGRELTGFGRRLVDAVETVLRRDPDRQRGLALQLERAGLDITPGEFGAAVVAGGAILALLGFGIFGLIGVLFLPAVGIAAAFGWLRHKATARRAAFVAQLDSTLQLMSGSLRSGFGVMQALGTVAEEAESPTSDEFSRVLGEVRLGRDVGDALRSSGTRIDSPDYDWTIQAIEISREVGGNLAEVLDNVSQTIRQRNTLRRQVQALSAEGRVSALILFLLPIVMLVWMRFSNPEYLELLFDRTSGQIALAAGVALLLTGGLWMRKIVRIPF